MNKESDSCECKMKGRNLCLGYLNDESGEFKNKLDEKGYFKSGDFVIYDEDNFLSIAGRNDDILETPV